MLAEKIVSEKSYSDQAGTDSDFRGFRLSEIDADRAL